MILGFTNGQQFKAKIKNKAQQEHILPQILMQEVLSDELIERISISDYRDNLILKGGFLIASLLGIDTRSTRDIDTSIKGLDVSRDEISKVFKSICDMNENSDIQLTLKRIEDIRESAEYSGFRVHIEGIVYASRIEVKIDVSTGDVITPSQIEYRHHMIFNDQSVLIMAYNIETILAEKLETIVSRQELNTRLKDYYDLYMFDRHNKNDIDFQLLKSAIIETLKNREDTKLIGQFNNILEHNMKSPILETNWKKYQNSNYYANNISFEDTCNSDIDLVKQSEIDQI
ncbi:nucleotidyl transferase AbiEii/AbiGii toxin family protein [Companilactobacillus kimchiensis]|uniref:Abortive infection protein AbiGII n=1 Tax=Companilactobacillus kimchiensis TaxID=993692 RepID=A0A0R2LK97_9LACO|nr:nucleotidyl transferase AbiEii/AbiGii toxin family protein [Companilactobacillus kimchiensis]KRO00588.1 hypothetical protein IV57_GL001025 [Companilactobacillus kimchiensis]